MKSSPYEWNAEALAEFVSLMFSEPAVPNSELLSSFSKLIRVLGSDTDDVESMLRLVTVTRVPRDEHVDMIGPSLKDMPYTLAELATEAVVQPGFVDYLFESDHLRAVFPEMDKEHWQAVQNLIRVCMALIPYKSVQR